MDTFSALADPKRRGIIELIATNGALTATDISDKFSISPQAISQHLKILREAKVVNMEKSAQKRIYTLNTNSLQGLEGWASKMVQLWEEKFCRLDNVLEDLKNGR